MRNCIVAQSGGPTSVINASFVGVFDQNLESKFYDNVYAGINGIEGILRGDILNLSNIPYVELKNFKYTPSSALGSCRYKMKDFSSDPAEYNKLFSILEELQIDTFFYIGGNDSMDTVRALSDYVKDNNLKTKILGIPKTIDNDLMFTDHTPGFGSAAKFIAATTLECYLDSSVYTNNGIFILETMGRDTGWLTASSYLAKINGRPVADFIYVPEVIFSVEKFLKDIKKKFTEQNQVFIVASEGIKDKYGNFLGKMSLSGSHDKFGHTQLGGVCNYLKQLIIDDGITSRVKTSELGVSQRCAMHFASQTDIDEAYMVGKDAVKYAIESKSGYMVSIKRVENKPYKSVTELVEASKVANNVKYLPSQWINEDKNGLTDAVCDYITPLILGTPKIEFEDGLPKYTILNKKATICNLANKS